MPRPALSAISVGTLFALLLATPARAADKGAEGDLRWALNYCGKVSAELEKQRGKDTAPAAFASALKRAQAEYAKYADYLAKAKGKDAAVTESDSVFDKKTGETFAQGHARCAQLEAQLAAAAKELETKQAAEQARRDEVARQAATADAEQKTAEQDKVAAYEARKAEESKQWAADENKRLALEAAKDAVWGTCSGFKGRAGSSGIDDAIAAYEASKTKALSLLPAIVDETYAVDLKAEAGGPSVTTTRTFKEWFAWCDEQLPAHAKAVRAAEAAAAAKEQQDNQARRAADQKLRAEQAARFKALVASTGGDRQRVLQSKGFLPWWPRNGDLKTAPVWKWEINITHQATRCESYQFSGDTLKKNYSELGACP